MKMVVVLLLLAMSCFGQSSLSLSGPGQIKAGQSFQIQVSLAGTTPAAFQFTVATTTDVASLTATVGQNSSAASKTVSCNSYPFGGTQSFTCVVYGINMNLVADGTVIVLTATTVARPASSSIPFTIIAPVESDASGTSIAVTANPTWAASISNPCDINADGAVNAADVTAVANQVLGSPGMTCDINGDGKCNILDIQAMINVVMGGACPLGVSTVAFNYYRYLRADHAQVGSSDSSNFPMLVSISSADFKDVAHGGHVQDSGGADILFFSDSAGLNQLPSEIDNYDNVNGTLLAWVQVPTLSHTSDTTIYVLYGNASPPSRTTDPWDTGFQGVYHMGDGTTLSTTDSTGNVNLTNNGPTPAGSGKIAGSASFNSTAARYLSDATAFNFTSTAFTISFWVNCNSLATFQDAGQGPIIIWKGGFQSQGYYQQIETAGDIQFVTNQSGAFQVTKTAAGVITTGNWFLVAITRSGASVRIFVNGSDATSIVGTHVDPGTSSDNFQIGAYAVSYYADALVDEVRMSNMVRPADWILAEYNNQKSSSTFLTVGPETTPGATNVAAIALSPDYHMFTRTVSL